MEDQEYNERYEAAKKRVKILKGFYVHAIVYVLFNLLIVAQNVRSGMSPTDLDNYWTAIFWGIGLLAHAAGVFIPSFFLGKNWEERKTRELLDKYK